MNEGKVVVDASFIEVPRQRNKKEENEKIKAGEGEELWNDQPKKKRQKDIDARWINKNYQASECHNWYYESDIQHVS